MEIVDREGRVIIIEYDPKPIPTRVFDWNVWYDGDEELGWISTGVSMEQALLNFLESHE